MKNISSIDILNHGNEENFFELTSEINIVRNIGVLHILKQLQHHPLLAVVEGVVRDDLQNLTSDNNVLAAKAPEFAAQRILLIGFLEVDELQDFLEIVQRLQLKVKIAVKQKCSAAVEAAHLASALVEAWAILQHVELRDQRVLFREKLELNSVLHL